MLYMKAFPLLLFHMLQEHKIPQGVTQNMGCLSDSDYLPLPVRQVTEVCDPQNKTEKQAKTQLCFT